MGDVACPKCGEPWDSYSLQPGIYNSGDGDLTRGEAMAFLEGKGCPSCQFGTACPICSGSGIETYCKTCGGNIYGPDGNGRVNVWSPSRSGYGYSNEKCHVEAQGAGVVEPHVGLQRLRQKPRLHRRSVSDGLGTKRCLGGGSR